MTQYLNKYTYLERNPHRVLLNVADCCSCVAEVHCWACTWLVAIVRFVQIAEHGGSVRPAGAGNTLQAGSVAVEDGSLHSSVVPIMNEMIWEGKVENKEI